MFAQRKWMESKRRLMSSKSMSGEVSLINFYWLKKCQASYLIVPILYYPSISAAQHPPWLSLPADRYVRIVGETLRIPCEMKNQGHYYNITWSSSEKVKWCVSRVQSNYKHEIKYEIIGEELNQSGNHGLVFLVSKALDNMTFVWFSLHGVLV